MPAAAPAEGPAAKRQRAEHGGPASSPPSSLSSSPPAHASDAAVAECAAAIDEAGVDEEWWRPGEDAIIARATAALGRLCAEAGVDDSHGLAHAAKVAAGASRTAPPRHHLLPSRLDPSHLTASHHLVSPHLVASHHTAPARHPSPPRPHAHHLTHQVLANLDGALAAAAAPIALVRSQPVPPAAAAPSRTAGCGFRG
jgi:hypothetical protein